MANYLKTQGISVAELQLYPNYKLLPITLIDANEEGCYRFNDVYNWIRSRRDVSLIVRTESGGISVSFENFRPPMYDVRADGSGVELTIVAREGMARVQFRANYLKDETTMSGRTAFIMFANKARELCGIDMRQRYWQPGGVERRQEVPRYIVDCNDILIEEYAPISRALVWDHVHHLDFRSSFGAGLANAYPELRPVVEWFFERRGENPRYKGVLNSLIGVMWSAAYDKAGYIELSKSAIADNNRRMEEMTARLEQSGRTTLLRNTDGIWYSGKLYPEDEMSGEGLGQWHHDHIDCRLRVKSRGAYEYIENGVYHPVLRGRTKLDSVKSRSEWEWGDIYNESAERVYKFEFKEEEGMVVIDG